MNLQNFLIGFFCGGAAASLLIGVTMKKMVSKMVAKEIDRCLIENPHLQILRHREQALKR